MPTSKITYVGDLRTEAVHLKSQEKIITDAPTDNNGKGEAFSPTDLVATALSSCKLTIMGIKARNSGIDIEGATSEVTKVMASDPRRISEIHVAIQMPKDKTYTDKEKLLLKNAAEHCPVIYSIHPDIKVDFSINY